MAETIRFTDAEAYDRSTGVWSDLIGRQFLDWVAPPPARRWVDIGCGSGAFTRLLAAHCAPAAIDAIDPAEAQIAYARTRPVARPASFHTGDALALPFADRQFDAAMMALVLFFVPDPARGVAEMARVVRPGGIVCAYVWDLAGGGTPNEPFWAEFRALGISPMSPPRPDAAPLAALKALWTGAGLESVQTRVITAERSYPDFETFWRIGMTAAAVGPTIAALAPDAAAGLKERIRAKVPTDANGQVRLTTLANAVCGLVPAAQGMRAST